LFHGETLLVTTTHDLEDVALELLQNQKKSVHYLSMNQKMHERSSCKKFIKVYLTQRITKDLLGDPFVNKGTPVIDMKVLEIGTNKQSGA
jgi:hypothetical protein